jgi:uncharacterized membrane protein
MQHEPSEPPPPVRDPYEEFQAGRKFGDRLADRLAAFGGSWWFVSLLVLVLAGWMFVNATAHTGEQPLDPYPYFLMCFVLSVLSVLQAPVIMMSQNFQAARERFYQAHDHRTNLQAAREIRQLHAKVDALHALVEQLRRER